jgi:hypothetical protein
LSTIPKLRGLQEITFELARGGDSEEAVQTMIGSLKKNMSLECINFTSRFIGEDDQSKIQLYSDRNKCIVDRGSKYRACKLVAYDLGICT